MKNNLLILGKGFIGSRLQELLRCPVSKKKIYSLSDATQLLQHHAPQVLINCVGYTGENNVDDCEKNPDKTLFVNSYVPLMLAEACLRRKIKLVHISSGCIYHFDYGRDRPVKEERLPDFFELYYSRSKTYAERALEILSRKYHILILRIRIPLDERPHHKNILTKLISAMQVIDIPNSVTYIPDFAEALLYLLKKNATGVYNVVNKGALKYPELMRVYQRYKPNFKFQIIDYKKLNSVRTNLIMSTQKLEKAGFKIRNIHEVLDECVRHYVEYSSRAVRVS